MALNVLNAIGDMDIIFGFPTPIKDHIYENFNDVHKTTKKKIKKICLQQWEGILSLFQNVIQSWKVRRESIIL